MFEHSFVGASVKTNRGWPVVASLTIQFSLVGAALLVPLVNPEILPRAVWTALPLAAPPPPAPPPAAAPVVEQVMRTVRSVMDGARMLLPRAIPRKVALIDDGDLVRVPGVLGGMEGSIPNGVPNSVINSIVEAARISAPPPPVAHEAPAARPKEMVRLKTGGNVQDALIVHRVMPVYPPLARQARIEGKVVFKAVISARGLIQSLQLVGGHPLLVEAARDAVRQWRYRPTLLNGDPCEVDTVIEVNFTLNR